MPEGVTTPPAIAPYRSQPALLARRRPLSLRHNFSWTLAGNVVYSAANQGMLILLAKLASPEVVGRYGLALAVTTPIIMFSNLKLRAVQATDARREYRFGHYLGLRLLTTALALLVIVGLLPFQPRAVMPVLLFLGLAKTFESISDAYYGLLQQHERMDCIAISLMLKGPASLAATIGVYALTHSLAWSLAAMALVWAALLVGYDAPVARRVLQAADPTVRARVVLKGLYAWLAPVWETRVLVRLAWIGLPLGCTVAIGNLQKNVPRYFVAHYGGLHELGIFTALASLISLGNLVVNSLGQSASPRLSQLYARGDRRRFLALVCRLMGVGAALGVLGVAVAAVAGRPLLALLYRPEYARHPEVLLWLMAAAGLDYLYIFWGSAVSAMRRFGVQLPIHAASLLAIAGASAWFLPRVGLVGAAYGLFAGSLFCLLAYVLVATQVLRQDARAAMRGGR